MSEQEQPNNPLHGVTLRAMVEALVETHGWEELGLRIRVRCFNHNPTVNASLPFLRKTEWARTKVERLYLAGLQKAAKNKKRNARRKGQRLYRAEQEALAAAGEPTMEVVESTDEAAPIDVETSTSETFLAPVAPVDEDVEAQGKQSVIVEEATD